MLQMDVCLPCFTKRVLYKSSHYPTKKYMFLMATSSLQSRSKKEKKRVSLPQHWALPAPNASNRWNRPCEGGVGTCVNLQVGWVEICQVFGG